MAETAKPEPLPWFAFNIAAYVTDTMRLTTEAHGAYLLLLLDYYGGCQPCPDDDFVLAAVAKLSEEAWAKHRKVLEPLFDVRDGHWYHKRVEREMQEAMLKHRSAVERAAMGAAARWTKKDEKPGKTPAKPHRSARSIHQAVLEAVPEASSKQCLEDAHLTLNNNNSLSTAAPAETDLQEREGDDESIGAPIPAGWQPSAATMASCLLEATPAEVQIQIATFVNRNQHEGGFSNNWNAAFGTWWIRFREFRAKAQAAADKAAKRAPARIEVNKTPDTADAPPAMSMEATIDKVVQQFARGMQWSRHLGPEPGMLGCKIDPDVLRKHGLDPKTGMKLREPTS